MEAQTASKIQSQRMMRRRIKSRKTWWRARSKTVSMTSRPLLVPSKKSSSKSMKASDRRSNKIMVRAMVTMKFMMTSMRWYPIEFQ